MNWYHDNQELFVHISEVLACITWQTVLNSDVNVKF